MALFGKKKKEIVLEPVKEPIPPTAAEINEIKFNLDRDLQTLKGNVADYNNWLEEKINKNLATAVKYAEQREHPRYLHAVGRVAVYKEQQTKAAKYQEMAEDLIFDYKNGATNTLFFGKIASIASSIKIDPIALNAQADTIVKAMREAKYQSAVLDDTLSRGMVHPSDSAMTEAAQAIDKQISALVSKNKLSATPKTVAELCQDARKLL